MSTRSSFGKAIVFCLAGFLFAQPMQAQTNDETRHVELRLKPAEISTERFRRLKIPKNLVLSDAYEGDLREGTPEVLVDRGTIYVATPDDTGSDQVFDIPLQSPDGLSLIHI